ncbi:MAG: hypothetical protein ACI8X5_002418 [Planctomycetota bacterium]|jgi:hypothetical protein
MGDGSTPLFVAGIKALTKRKAPPGYYMLFVLDQSDSMAPSEAKTVRIIE